MSAPWQLCRIGKEYEFSAAHRLPMVPHDHPCHRMHGHNYRVDVEVSGAIAEDGFCAGLDYYTLDEVMAKVLGEIDHQTLNEFMPNPTAELIAVWILERCPPSVTRIILWETPSRWADVGRFDTNMKTNISADRSYEVRKVFTEILRYGYLEDRLEYDKEDLSKSYPWIDGRGIEMLYNLIHTWNGTDE